MAARLFGDDPKCSIPFYAKLDEKIRSVGASVVHHWLDIGAALSAFVAAIFWFLSAFGKLPPMVSYWDSVPEHDPFYRAVKFSARMNRWAAGFSGLSALFMSIELFAN